MSFKFPVKTEEEILNLLPAGEYSFIIEKAEITLSKSNNTPMVKLLLSVQDSHGQIRQIIDYLTTNNNMLFKVKHFCDAVGLEEKYQSGEFTEKDCVGKKGKCKIKVDPGNEQFGPKNTVKDYVKSSSSSVKSTTDDVPFFDDEMPNKF